MSGSSPERRWRLAFAIAAVAAACLAAALIAVVADDGGDGSDDCSIDGFDRGAWERGEDPLDQANYLIDCGLLEGRGKDDVRELLGPPGNEQPGIWEYTLQPEAFGVDFDLLAIEFDPPAPDGTVIRAFIGQS